MIFKTRVRDVEDTLAQLVHDDDQVIAAAAIQLVERRRALVAGRRSRARAGAPRSARLVRLRGGVVGAGRAADVARAAARALARAAARRWSSPIVCGAIQLFDFASVDELFRIAGLGRQVRHEAGRVLYEAGPSRRVAAVPARRTRDRRTPSGRERSTHRPCSASRTCSKAARCAPRCARSSTAICLSLTTEEFLSLLSENVEIAQGIFRLLIETGGARSKRRRPHRENESRGKASCTAGSRPISSAGSPAACSRSISCCCSRRARSSPARRRRSCWRWPRTARPVTLKPGADPLVGLEPSILVVLSGAVRVERDGYDGRNRGRRRHRRRRGDAGRLPVHEPRRGDHRRRRRSASRARICSTCSRTTSICCRASSAACCARARQRSRWALDNRGSAHAPLTNSLQPRVLRSCRGRRLTS